MAPEAWALLKWGHQGRPLYWKGEPLIIGNAKVIPAVQSLGDVEILTSFLILTWLGFDAVSSEMTDQMCVVRSMGLERTLDATWSYIDGPILVPDQ